MRARRAGRPTDREVLVVAAVLDAESEKAATHLLGLSHSTVKHHLANARSKVGAETTAQLVWILGTRLPEPEDGAEADDQRSVERLRYKAGLREPNGAGLATEVHGRVRTRS